MYKTFFDFMFIDFSHVDYLTSGVPVYVARRLLSFRMEGRVPCRYVSYKGCPFKRYRIIRVYSKGPDPGPGAVIRCVAGS